MAGLTDILNTARDALAAQGFGLTVTGQNISNVNTPDYVRREALLATRAVGSRSDGTVQILGLRRATDQYVHERFLGATGMSSYASERDQLLGTIEQQFNDVEDLGVGNAINNLFTAFSTIAGNPNDPATRQDLLSKASIFAERLNETASNVESFRTELVTEAQNVASDINLRIGKLADLGKKIQVADLAGQDAADLKDQRDTELRALSGLVDIRTFTNDAGELVIQGAGTTLVEGGTARQLSIDLAPSGNLRVLASKAGGAGTDVTGFVGGGRLAGIIEVRDVDSVAVLESLDQLAFDTANAVNTQHAAGFGLDGSTGNNLFSVSATEDGAARSIKLDAALVGHPEKIAASSTALGLPGDNKNALALSQLRDVAFAMGGTQTATGAYAALVGDIGLRKATAASTASTREAILAQTETMKESVSGVSLDEEMINLTKFQRAYQAASKVLSTADELLEELLDRVAR
jgi:flagellar hook-associated protein 1 FlgK